MIEPPIYSVTELNELVNKLLTTELGPVLVQGEVSDLRTVKNRWLSFTIKDSKSVANCFMALDRVELAEGAEIKALVQPKIYSPFGKYNLTVMAAELVGEGLLSKAYLELHRRLKKEGLFDEERKRPLPAYPDTIGLVTSPTGAAITDFLRVLTERWGGARVVLVPTLVQGLKAPGQITAAINHLNQDPSIDLIVVTRGGGSREDLQTFDNERLARAIAASRIPTLVGIGHERDLTIAELVADRRAATPSNAAQLAVPDRAMTNHEIDQLFKQIVDSISTRIATNFDLLAKISSLSREKVLEGKTRITQLEQLITHLDPLQILERGYSLTTISSSGELVKSVDQLRPGDRISTRLGQGKVESEVIE